MEPLVQSAIDAANQGDNNKALELCKQALAANPNDVDAWLVVAAVVDQPERKRMCLNRVLALDPDNQIAHDELLDMDRLTAGEVTPSPADLPAYGQEHPAGPSVSASESVPETGYLYTDPGAPTDESITAPEQPQPVTPEVPAAAPQPSHKPRAEKPIVFKYPLFYHLFAYFFVIITGCGGLYALTKNWLVGLLLLVPALLLVIVSISLWTRVEVSKPGLRVVTVLHRSAVRWSDIQSMKKSTGTLELRKSNGKTVNVPTMLSGYPRLIEILREKRPDLFAAGQ